MVGERNSILPSTTPSEALCCLVLEHIPLAKLLIRKTGTRIIKESKSRDLGYLPFTWKTTEILVGKSKRLSVWKASESMGCDLRRCNFPSCLVFQLI